MGKLDESNPIFFVRFHGADGAQIARQPLSVGALLELRATAAEIATFNEWAERRPSGERVVSEILFRQERIAILYDPKFTTYSAAAHLLANCTSQSDLVSVCRLGASLADLCLNVTSEAFASLRTPAIFDTFTPSRLSGFRRTQNRGYLFACLSYHARTSSFRSSDADNIASLTERAGIGTPPEIYSKAIRFLEQRRKPSLNNANLRRIREDFQQMGSMIMKWRADRLDYTSSAKEHIEANLPSPLVITNDCEEMNVTDLGISSVDSHLLYSLDARVRELTRSALRAGRGLDFGFSDYVY